MDTKAVFEFLCRKYVQRQDARQKSMGLHYTEAETHDLANALVREFGKPIDMVLHCPACGLQHIDKDNTEDLRIEAAETGRDREGDKELDRWLEDNEWTNPPHRSHLCLGCKHIWRPADVPTNGVKAVSTTGKADSPIVPSSNQTLRHVAVIAHSGGLAQLSEADALAAVRRLTLAHWDKRHDQRKAVLNALYDSHQKAAT